MMSPELSAVVGITVGGAAVMAATPVAIRAAVRTNFYDNPRDYHQHEVSTPLLGGAAVAAAFLLASLITGGATRSYWVIVAGAVVMWAVGTIDDRVAVAPAWRLLAEAAMGGALFAAGLGFKFFGGNAADVVLTIGWVAGITTAFNLMDNLDGACATVGSVSALGIGVLALLHGEAAYAAMGFALAAACAGFLRWNLAGPARVFLGDGGSMVIGFLVAALAMAATRNLHDGYAGILALAPIGGLVMFDAALVSVSRIRRGVPLVTGGRDHLSHRVLKLAGSPALVAIALASMQAVLCVIWLVSEQLGQAVMVVLPLGTLAVALCVIPPLESRRLRPPHIATDERLADAVPVAID